MLQIYLKKDNNTNYFVYLYKLGNKKGATAIVAPISVL